MKETNFSTLLGRTDQMMTKDGALLAHTAQKKGVLVLREQRRDNFVVLWVPPPKVDAAMVNAKVEQVRSALKGYCDDTSMQVCLHDGDAEAKTPWSVPQKINNVSCHLDIVKFSQAQGLLAHSRGRMQHG